MPRRKPCLTPQGLDSPAFLPLPRRILSVFLLLLPAAQVVVQVGILPVVVREITHPPSIFRSDGLRCPEACRVVVEQAVDALIQPQCVNGFRHVGGGVEYDVVLPVKVGHGGAVLHPEREEREVVHEPLEHQAFFPLFPLLPDVGDVLRRDAALEEGVAHLVAARHIRETNGEVGLAVVGEAQFPAFSFRQSGVDASPLQVTEQCRMGEVADFQLPEARL